MGEGMSRILLCGPGGMKVHNEMLGVAPGPRPSNKQQSSDGMLINQSCGPPIFNCASSPLGRSNINRSISSSYGDSAMHLNDDSQSIAELILGDDIARKFFLEYLLYEHAEENILFYEDAEKFISSQDIQYIKVAEILSITYLKDGCNTEINVSDHLKNHFQSLTDSAASKDELSVLLKLMQKEIAQILAGVICRYKNSEFFTDWTNHEGMLADKMMEDKAIAIAERNRVRAVDDNDDDDDDDELPPEVLIIKESLPIMAIIGRKLELFKFKVDYGSSFDEIRSKLTARESGYSAILIDLDDCPDFVTFLNAFRGNGTMRSYADPDAYHIVIGMSRHDRIGVGGDKKKKLSNCFVGFKPHSVLNGAIRKPFKIDDFISVLERARNAMPS